MINDSPEVSNFNIHYLGPQLRWRSPLVMSFREIPKFDCPRATLLSGGGLHYDHETFGEEHWTWMKK